MGFGIFIIILKAGMLVTTTRTVFSPVKSKGVSSIEVLDGGHNLNRGSCKALVLLLVNETHGTAVMSIWGHLISLHHCCNTLIRRNVFAVLIQQLLNSVFQVVKVNLMEVACTEHFNAWVTLI